MEENFGNKYGDKILLDIQQKVARLDERVEIFKDSFARMNDKIDEQIRQTAVLEDMIKRQTAMGERVGNISERLTHIETRFEHLETKVNANSRELKEHETPEEYLHKKSYNFLVAAGAALIGVIISKMGAIIDWFRGL